MGCKKRAQKAKIVERWQNWTSLKRNASALPGREWRRRWWSWWCRRRASRRPGPCRSCRASSWCCCAAGGSWRCGRRGGSSPQYSCFRQLFFHFRSRLRRTDRSQPFWTSFVPWKLGFQSRAEQPWLFMWHVTNDWCWSKGPWIQFSNFLLQIEIDISHFTHLYSENRGAESLSFTWKRLLWGEFIQQGHGWYTCKLWQYLSLSLSLTSQSNTTMSG